MKEPADHALGRSRGGFGSKIHLVCDSQGLPLAVRVTAGQQHESTEFEATLNEVSVERSGRRARQRPYAVAGDKAYSAPRIRRWLKRKGIKAAIPERKDETARRATKPGRKPVLNKELYR